MGVELHHQRALSNQPCVSVHLQVQKKVFIENMIPIIIALKSKLEQQRSPVLKDLMGYLQVS